MAKSMSPSQATELRLITTGHAAKIADLVISKLLKSGLPADSVQKVLETKAAYLVEDFIKNIRERVEHPSGWSVPRNPEERAYSPEEVWEGPSEGGTITPGQAAKLLDMVIAKLRRSGLSPDSIMTVFRNYGGYLTYLFVHDVHMCVKAVSVGLIIRRVRVSRSGFPHPVLNPAGVETWEYDDDNVASTASTGEGDEVEVVFFSVGCSAKGHQVEKEYELRGLKPAGPDMVYAVNRADKTFYDQYPNGTQWKYSEGKWCFAPAERFMGGGYLLSNERTTGLHGSWWLAGVRK